MISKREYAQYAERTLQAFAAAGIAVTEEEARRIEVADFGLNDLSRVGLQLLVYVNTDRVCAKEMVLFPFQTCPEHIHVGGVDDNGARYEGKQETFRVRKGTCYLYVGGENGDPNAIRAVMPPTKVTVFHEIVLREGEQYTLYPETWHWFQAGAEGAVISEFSTTSRDESDLFRDERIRRIPEIETEETKDADDIK